MARVSKKKRIFLFIGIVITIGFITAIYILFKPVLPFFLPWKTHQSNQGFSISFPQNWYLNSEFPVTISEWERFPEPLISPVTGINYNEPKKIISIVSYTLNSNLDENIIKIKKDYDHRKLLGQSNQTVSEQEFTIEDKKAVLLIADPNIGEYDMIDFELLVEQADSKTLWVWLRYESSYAPFHHQSFYYWAIDKVLNSVKLTK